MAEGWQSVASACSQTKVDERRRAGRSCQEDQMSMSMVRIGLTAVAMSVASIGAFAGTAAADGVRVEVPAPFFFPTPQFDYNDGYYRTGRGRYYHYDRDRDGWHYGRNHREGVRYEGRWHRYHDRD
jgi:hypothetical protein